MAAQHHNFTQSQFSSYLRCIKNIEVGDRVEFYTDRLGYAFHQITEYTQLALVSAVIKDPPKEIKGNFDYLTYNGLYEYTRDPIPLIILATDHPDKGRFWKYNNWGQDYRKYLTDTKLYYGSIRPELLVKSIFKNTK